MNFMQKNKNDVEQKSPRNMVFAVYDEKARSYGGPIIHPEIGVAIRSFTAAIKNPQSFLNQFPEDYSLYSIGTYDETSGKLVSYPEPQFIIRASDIIQTLKSEPKPEVINEV